MPDFYLYVYVRDYNFKRDRIKTYNIIVCTIVKMENSISKGLVFDSDCQLYMSNC